MSAEHSSILQIHHLAQVALVTVLGLLVACTATPVRDTTRPPAEPTVAPATWARISATIRTLSAEAEQKAHAYAQGAVEQWVERVRARTETDFIPWATGYWTHQWLALKLAWYRMNSADDDVTAVTARLSEYLQDQYRSQVLEPVAREIDPVQVMDQAATLYAQTLAGGIRTLPARYGVPVRQFNEWLSNVPAIASPPGASLRDVVEAEGVTRLVAYQTLVEGIRGADEGAGLAGDRAAMGAVANRTAERLATDLAVRGGATAASVVGGGPGILLGLGIIAWDASAYERERPVLETALRSNLDSTLRTLAWDLPADPEYGVLAPVVHIASRLAAALPGTPVQTDVGPLQGLF